MNSRNPAIRSRPPGVRPPLGGYLGTGPSSPDRTGFPRIIGGAHGVHAAKRSMASQSQ